MYGSIILCYLLHLKATASTIVTLKPGCSEPSSVLQWLNETEELSMETFRGFYDRDITDGFPEAAADSVYSESVFQTFSLLNVYFNVLSKMKCSNAEIWNSYMRIYSKIINKVLLAYAEMVQRDFPKYESNERLACILMNNIQETKIKLEKLYKRMGTDEQLDKQADDILKQLQQKLNGVLEKLASMFVQSYERSILNSMEKLRGLLMKVNGSGQVKKEQVTGEVYIVMEPLMDFVDSQLTTCFAKMEKTVFKKVLKELWRIVICSMGNIVLLPKLADKSDQMAKSLTPEQCMVLEVCLDQMKTYFYAEDNGLKRSYLDKTPELHSLKYALSHYTQTTDSLIKTFISSQKEQDAPSQEEPVGEVNVQVDVFTHPGTGEHKLTVKVVAASDLRWEATSFRPFVKINLVGPHLAGKKRKFSTKSRSNNWAPKFNETFHFLIGNEAYVEHYELMFAVKDYCFASKNRLIGVGVMQLRGVAEQGSCACWVQLGKRLQVDETGLILLRILSQRQQDEIAKEFVRLKSESRYEADNGCGANALDQMPVNATASSITLDS